MTICNYSYPVLLILTYSYLFLPILTYPLQEKAEAEARERAVWQVAEEAERVLAVADEQVV